MPLIFRLARRELRGGLSSFGVFLACLALGVAAIALVGSLSAAAREGVRRDARGLLGGDLEIASQMQALPEAAVAELERAGQVSRVASMRVMAASGDALPVLAELKGVDAAYPLYGEMETEPAGRLADLLGQRPDGSFGAVAEEGLLARLDLHVGGTLVVGQARFTITARITREPDRIVSVFSLGPRLLVSRQGMEATGLMLPGSLVRHEARVKLPAGADATRLLARLEADFPDGGFRARTYQRASPRITDFLDRFGLYLTFVGLTAILVGGLGMAGAVRSYLQGKARSIAIMKCVGAPPNLVFAVYMAQVLALAALGILAGVAVGAAGPYLAADLMGRFLPVRLVAAVYPEPLAVAAGFGLLTAVTFSLGPLLAARLTPAAGLFRGYADAARPRLTTRMRLLAVGAAVALAGYGLAVTHDRKLAAAFIASTLVAFAVFWLAALLIRRAAAHLAPRHSPRLRLALRALHRPGNATVSVVLALGLGLTVLAAVAQIDGNFREQLRQRLPEHAPAYYFIDIQPDQVAGFEEAARSVPGVSGVARQPMLRARITAVNGVPADELNVPENYRWVLRSDRGVTYSATPPEGTVIDQGAWWPADYRGGPAVSLAADVAKALGLSIGGELTLNILGRDITATVMSTRTVEWETLAMNFAIIFPPGFLENAPQTSIATVYCTPQAESAVLRAVTARFPNITAIRVREVLETADDMLSGINAGVRAVAAVALVSGLLVLGSALRAGTRRRIYEAVVLKVVGATGTDILATLAYEYALLGLSAGLTAALLGAIAAWGVVTRFLHLEWIPLPGAAAVTIVSGIAFTLLVGLSGVRRVLREKPAVILRNE